MRNGSVIFIVCSRLAAPRSHEHVYRGAPDGAPCHFMGYSVARRRLAAPLKVDNFLEKVYIFFVKVYNFARNPEL